MTTVYEGSDLDGWLSHFFSNETLKAIVRKVLEDMFVLDFNALRFVYANPAYFYAELEKYNAKAFNILKRMLDEAAFLTKAWQNEPWAKKVAPPPPPAEDDDLPGQDAPVLARMSSDTLQQTDAQREEEVPLKKAIRLKDELPCFERAALVLFEYLREKRKDHNEKDVLNYALKFTDVVKLVEDMKEHGKRENLDSDSHNFGKIFNLGLPG